MGWFLTRKKRSSKKPASKPRASASSAGPKPWDPQRTLLALKVIGGIAAGVGLVFGWRYGETALIQYTAVQHSDPVGIDDVELVDAPAWMTPAVRQRVALVVAEHAGSNPMDGQSLRRAAANLAQEPWVAKVERVRRLSRNRIEVVADFREPIAVVQAKDGYHLIDRKGVRLPVLYYREQAELLDLPVITGVTAPPPPHPGDVWAGNEIDAVLPLIELLRTEPYFKQIKAFDASERDARGRIRLALITERGMVRWGLSPAQEQTVEPTPAIKLSWLRQVAQRMGSIDAGGRVVDIYGASIQLSQPLTMDAMPIANGH